MYNPLQAADIEFLKSIIPADRIFVGDEILEDYHHDELSGTEYPPEALVFVTSTEETAAIMKYAYEHNIPVTARGSGTGRDLPVECGYHQHQGNRPELLCLSG